MRKEMVHKTFMLMLTMISFTLNTMAQDLIKQNTNIFPIPEKGFKKMIIDLPHSDNDGNKKIEIIVGKMMEVDACNYFALNGKLVQKDLQGWGYNYFVFETNGNVTSTMIACPDTSKRQSFVTAPTEMVQYNGKLPIVVYIPQDCDVKFKIYKADNDTYSAAEERSK